MNKMLFALVLSVYTAAAQAGASIDIGTVYDYMDGDKSAYLKRVFNRGGGTAFVRINVYEMSFDAQGRVTETPLDTQGTSAAERKGLMASPARLIVPAKGTQSTRLIYRGERDVERYYRVRYVPVVPEKEDQFNVSDEERETYKASMSAGVNIMTGYGAIFFVRPEKVSFNTRINNGATEYRVENAGNSTLELDEFKDCSLNDERDCRATKKHILRPGKAFSFAKEVGRVYRFNLIEAAVKKSIEVKG